MGEYRLGLARYIVLANDAAVDIEGQLPRHEYEAAGPDGLRIGAERLRRIGAENGIASYFLVSGCGRGSWAHRRRKVNLWAVSPAIAIAP